MVWLIPALAVLAAALLLCWRVARDRHEMAQMLAERVRTTALYRQLYPVLRECEGRCVEQIRLRRTEVVIRMFRPYKEVIRFSYAAHGLDDVENTEVLQALAQALAVDVPMLDDPKKFWFTRRSAPMDVGHRDVWFEYNVQPAYRDDLLRASYDRPQPEEGIIH